MLADQRYGATATLDKIVGHECGGEDAAKEHRHQHERATPQQELARER
jgi:hypothetical protein